MKVLIVNAHSSSAIGQSKFRQFHSRLSESLKATLYYGSNVEEVVRTKDQLSDIIFQENSSFNDPSNLERFRLYSMFIIEGEANVRPWNSAMRPVLMLLKMCIKENSKLIATGFGCLAVYHLLAINLDHTLLIGNKHYEMTVDPATGDLLQNGKIHGNVGLHSLRHASEGHSFAVKNHNIDKSVVLATKMHFPCTASFAGSPLLKNVRFPFAIYCTNTWMCNPAEYLKCHINVLVETDQKLPMVFAKNNLLAMVNFCKQFQTILENWMVEESGGTVQKQTIKRSETATDITLDNDRRRSVKSRPTTATISRTFTYASRPASSNPYKSPLKAQINPCVRTSGPYMTQDDMYNKKMRQSSVCALSKTYMKYGMQPDKYDIPNYVTRTFSKPVSDMQFRTVEKTKWISRKPFLLA